MASMTMVEAIRDALDVSMGRDDNVVVFGRTCQIYDCDAHTRAWYKAHLGYEQGSIPVKGGNATLLFK